MWNVTGKTAQGAEVSYKVSAGKEADKAYVMALGLQDHGKTEGGLTDALKWETITVAWVADNVQLIPAFTIVERTNYQVQKRIGKGLWERHSVRALRLLENATDALETAASENPSEVFRIVRTVTEECVVAVSKGDDVVATEKPDKPVKEEKVVAPVDPATADMNAAKATAAKATSKTKA